MATPYLTLVDGEARLHVIADGQLHVFEIAPAAIGRLAAESAGILWTMMQHGLEPRGEQVMARRQ